MRTRMPSGLPENVKYSFLIYIMIFVVHYFTDGCDLAVKNSITATGSKRAAIESLMRINLLYLVGAEVWNWKKKIDRNFFKYFVELFQIYAKYGFFSRVISLIKWLENSDLTNLLNVSFTWYDQNPQNEVDWYARSSSSQVKNTWSEKEI